MKTIIAVFLAGCVAVEEAPTGSPRNAALEAAAVHLVEALKDENVLIRERALRTLAALGPYAQAAVPLLIKALKDDTVKSLAIDALGEIGPAAEPAVPELVTLLGERHTTIRAREALVKIGPSKTSLELLVKAINDGTDDARCESAAVLGQFGGSAKDAVPTLVQALETNGRVADCAMYALGQVGRPAVSALVGILEDDEKGEARWRAAFALTFMGADAEQAVPSLENALNGNDETLRRMARQALTRIRTIRPAR